MLVKRLGSDLISSSQHSVNNLRRAFFLFALSLIIGTIGFAFIEDYPIVDALYMAVITISTVGFEEVRPLSQAGQTFSIVYIIFNIGVFAYAISAFTGYIIQGEIFKTMKMLRMEKKIESKENHVIVCGHGRYGNEVCAYFSNHKIPFVAIDMDEEAFEGIPNNYLYIIEDTTKDETLIKAGIKKARSIITALGDDTENLFTVMAARQLNPKINIISRAVHGRAVEKLKLGGANHIIMPTQIGGYFMATLESKPNAVEFFSLITNETISDIRYEEIDFEGTKNNCIGKTIRDLNIRSMTGTSIVAVKSSDGKYIVNPDPDIKIENKTSFIVLGTKTQLKTLKKYISNYS